MKKTLTPPKRSFSILITASLLAGCGAGAGTNAGQTAVTETTAASAQTHAEAGAAPQETIAVSGDAFDGSSCLTSDSIAGKYQDAYGTNSPNTEEYGFIQENGFRSVAQEPLSTFSADVDTASYANIRRFIRYGQSIPTDAVRIEEMLNYFDYDYPDPEGEEPFSVTTEYSVCPWNEDNRLLLIGLKAKEIDFANRPSSNLVFLLDVSGSMYADNKLPLVQKSFTMLAQNLDSRDRVSIVTYAGYESVVLDGVSGSDTAKIAAAISDLEAGGSTAGSAGIQKAYQLAEKNYIPGGNNRVILATDGDLNVGLTSQEDLTRLIEEKRKSGVHLSVLGVGTGNIKDNKMEALADNGDGNYSYLDSIYEAKKVLVDEMGGTLITVAKDVKLQVEFNPAYVSGYRLVGYENRILDKEDFHDDKVDAGEIGSGHAVTALYELIPAKTADAASDPGLKYQQDVSAAYESRPVNTSTELLTVSLRYKAPNGDASKLMAHPVESSSFTGILPENLAFAAAVAQFGMVLRDSENKGTATFDSVIALARSSMGQDSDPYRKEFLELVQEAQRIYGK
ncbi:MAG: VWA domain-containing protein [Hungatella sp.]|jgi:Ca-activated chloride channel family protein|nr:VWA domain-containing protein [Hungatella sp.]